MPIDNENAKYSVEFTWCESDEKDTTKKKLARKTWYILFRKDKDNSGTISLKSGDKDIDVPVDLLIEVTDHLRSKGLLESKSLTIPIISSKSSRKLPVPVVVAKSQTNDTSVQQDVPVIEIPSNQIPVSSFSNDNVPQIFIEASSSKDTRDVSSDVDKFVEMLDGGTDHVDSLPSSAGKVSVKPTLMNKDSILALRNAAVTKAAEGKARSSIRNKIRHRREQQR
jgi:hypothetical protein